MWAFLYLLVSLIVLCLYYYLETRQSSFDKINSREHAWMILFSLGWFFVLCLGVIKIIVSKIQNK